MKNKWKKTSIYLLLLSALFILGACQASSEDESVEVTTGQIQEQTIEETVTVTAVIEPRQQQELIYQGLVKDVNVALGDSVSRGQTLAVYADGTELKANQNGTVTALNIDEGQADLNAQAQQASIVVESLDDLVANFALNKSEADKVRVDQAVTLDYNGRKYQGHVSHLDATATSRTTGTGISHRLEGQISFDETPTDVIPGFDITGQITTASSENALVIPIEALRYDSDNQPFVYVIEDGKAKKQNIETGIHAHLYIEVLEGLSKDQVIILSAEEELSEGTPVQEASDNQ